ncbi:SpoIIIAH-like family protein [Fredinandcohnia sp. QZ13]|uniref:SpoIIIAH-like family protein n=1 Tax=Fredinandcohnia sp. QZ13 TaxID=3073144 RepID=UPI0028535C08|nr:SpoIIIAH-like family protein [Fredinandcohnia sp. QZ13]MDR4888879.1 SpoIIIAH-like family protein [Fredinandcohnia sp. QZ13]
MLLKKQTVWLLTMLSLVVVLSVYYITTPENNNNNVAMEQDEQKDNEKENVETSTENKDGASVTVEEDEDGNVISSVASDDMFAALRLEIDEHRSKLRSNLEDQTASTELTADQKLKAYDELKKLDDIETKEKIIEMLIKGNNYEDALVRVEGDKIKITVKAKESSKKAANDILRLVRSELGDLQNLAVQFEVTGEKEK